ncbi:hypothetical protein [Roseivivax sediminis]|uniref:Uncharacterized protein n=1 Tax=Roseivivax sediminis TaxID=936889 RepID=A0A1I1YMB5_9RHOB|nr:hypothetical protein [Roseivivax sediminis]SFE20657.1 hypothetical protein SAMN04515678_107110 [Roseivivax sediminis]
MPSWIIENAEVIGMIANVAMVVVWITYLNLFLVSFMRQNRSVLHISRAASEHSKGRCLVTNMGSQNVYILAVVIDIDTEDGRSRALVTDREEMSENDVDDMLERTLQGPLGSGEARDMGSFEDLARRAQARLGAPFDVHYCNGMTITVVAAPNQVKSLVGGCKRFDIRAVDDPAEPRFVPTTLLSPQITGPFKTKRLARMIKERPASVKPR